MRERFQAGSAWILLGILCLSAGFLSTGCRSEDPPPRSRDEVFRERLKLPALYLTADTHKRITAPSEKGAFVDEKSGEICWPAVMCAAPDCPGRKADGEPFVFVLPDRSIYVKSDGTFGSDPARAAAEADQVAGCPECLKNRKVDTESAQERQRYVDWVQPYVLPETAERLRELDDEDRRRTELFEQRRDRKVQ